MTQTVEVRRGAYQDSVALMQISQDLQRVEGVRSALVAMATELNLDLLDGMGFARPESSPNDMVVAIEADDDEAVGRALTALEDALTRRPVASSDGLAQPAAPTVATAARGAEADRRPRQRSRRHALQRQRVRRPRGGSQGPRSPRGPARDGA